MASRTEVDELKTQWEADPIWDIEDTDGFEDHREELTAFRKTKEAAWEQLRREEIRSKAKALKCSLEFALYIEYLESRIDALESAA